MVLAGAARHGMAVDSKAASSAATWFCRCGLVWFGLSGLVWFGLVLVCYGGCDSNSPPSWPRTAPLSPSLSPLITTCSPHTIPATQRHSGQRWLRILCCHGHTHVPLPRATRGGWVTGAENPRYTMPTIQAEARRGSVLCTKPAFQLLSAPNGCS